MKNEIIKELIVDTIVLYLFGSVIAGTFNVMEWPLFGRVILSVLWVLAYVTRNEDN